MSRKFLDKEGLEYYHGLVEEELESYAKNDGYYEDMSVGYAEDLIPSTLGVNSAPYLYRPAGGGLEIKDREDLSKIVGGSVVWNQLIEETNKSNHGRTYTFSNGKWTLDGTSDGQGSSVDYFRSYNAPGHKLFISEIGDSIESCNWYIRDVTNGTSIVSAAGEFGEHIVAIPSTCTNSMFYSNWNADSTASGTITIQAFDLTAMFGSTIADYIYALETATTGAGVAWFRKLFPKAYYPYSEPIFKHVEGLVSHDMTGFNQWDEEWELGYWYNGRFYSANNQLCTKNFIHVIPNVTYFYKFPSSVTNALNALCYDIAGNYISTIELTKNSTFVIPDGCHYIHLNFTTGYGTTYNHDICINLSDPSRNGEYEPYVKYSYPLDSDVVLRGIPKLDENNQLYYDGDTYESNGTVTRRYGIVDLGTLTWEYASNTFYASFPNKKLGRTNFIVSELYTVVDAHYRDIQNLEASGTLENSDINFKNSAYTDTVTFKAAMSGVYLIYELAESTTETADPYTNPQIVDSWGTEEYVIDDEVTIPIPVGHETKYILDLKSKIESAPESPYDDGDYYLHRAYGRNYYYPINNAKYIPTGGTTGQILSKSSNSDYDVEWVEAAIYPLSIQVTTPPTKTQYELGENFDPTGMVVTLTYSNGATEVLDNSELTYSVTNLPELGDITITIYYKNDAYTLTTTQVVTVVDIIVNSWDKFKTVIDRGVASVKCPVETQFTDTWYADNSTSYNAPWDVAHYNSNGDGYLLWHYGIPTDIQFDAPEALFYAPEGGIAAGEYYIEIKFKNGNWNVGDGIHFTLNNAMVEGDQFVLSNTGNPTDSAWNVYSFGSTTSKDSGTTDNATTGTKLGETSSVGNEYTNDIVCAPQRVQYGYNRLSQSAIIQYLNSAAAPGQWWTPKNPWDRPPTQHNSVRGFMAGIDSELLDIIEPVTITIGLNNFDANVEGKNYETMEVYFFLPSLTEMYVNPQRADEGEPWDYFKNLAEEAGLSGKFAQNTTYEILKVYRVSNTTQAVYARLRSCDVDNAIFTWLVNASGGVSYSTAYGAYSGQPACIIRKSS